MTTINHPDDRLSAMARRFDALAYEAEDAALAGFGTTHQQFVRAWMMRDLARMERLADTLAADLTALKVKAVHEVAH